MKQVLIIGAGPAGISAAQAAAAAGAAVTLCGDEPYLPYFRPQLTRVLAQPVPADKLSIRSQDWLKEKGITFLANKKAVHLDTTQKSVTWEDGETTNYDSLVLAMGASAATLQINYCMEYLTLRSYDDALAVRDCALARGRAVIIGGGLLGVESAFELKAAGVQTAIARQGYLLNRQLSPRAGAYFEEQVRAEGIELLDADSPDMSDAYTGACVLLTIGIEPNTSLLQDTGISFNRGVMVDEHMRTSIPDVYACGDLAEYEGVTWGLMLVAQEQGKVAGTSAAGGQAVYTPILPSPVLKAGKYAVFSAGQTLPQDGDRELSAVTEKGYGALILSNGVLTGVMLIGDIALGNKLKQAIAERRDAGDAPDYEEALRRLL